MTTDLYEISRKLGDLQSRSAATHHIVSRLDAKI